MVAFQDILEVLRCGTGQQRVAIYGSLVESIGQEEASKTWREICQYLDHLRRCAVCAELDNGDDDV